MRERILVTKLRLKPPIDAERSERESSLLGGRCAAAKTASKASPAKTCFSSSGYGFRRCLATAILTMTAAPARAADDPLLRARFLYNQRQFEAAVSAAEQARLTPAR